MKGRSKTGIMLANVIVVGLAAVSFLSMVSIQALYPFSDMVTYDRTPYFEWSAWGDDYELLLDEDPQFRTPMSFEVSGTNYVLDDSLEFGAYWWKVRGAGAESEPRKFTVVSTVALSRPERSVITNAGNTDLLVYRSGLAGAVTLAVNGTLEVREEENVKAEQK
jgi:hypothetical protein